MACCWRSTLTSSTSAAHAALSSRLLKPPISASALRFRIAAQQPHQHAASSPGANIDKAGAYTSMSSDPLGFWDTHPGLPLAADNGSSLFEDDAAFLDAQLHLLANAASDRAEMHSILAQQRDNCNKLFQRMLTTTSLTACLLSGLNGQAHIMYMCSQLSLGLPALLLNAGTAAMMAIINQFQPSQLAEEQRTAARLFRKIASDIHFALHVAPHLRQHPPSFLRDCRRRLQALDKAFPMPLTPGGLEKFPAKVVPPILIEPDISVPPPVPSCQNLSSTKIGCDFSGWDEHLSSELQRVATLLDHSDIPKYTGWAQSLVKVNKCLAMAAPLFAASAALLNVVDIISMSTSLPNILGLWAAVCSVMAVFANSFSNDMQLGMVFELYRNSAGYYMDVRKSIEETLQMPVEERENATLFRQRIAYQLGRIWPVNSTSIVSSRPAQDNPSKASSPLLPVDAKEAGTLF